ncbi:hypothetical protein Hanom_Chr16g01475891 [Helianthus anomalus]
MTLFSRGPVLIFSGQIRCDYIFVITRRIYSLHSHLGFCFFHHTLRLLWFHSSIIRLSSPSVIFIHILGFLQLHLHLSFSSNRIHEDQVHPQGQSKSILPIFCPNSFCRPSALQNLHHKVFRGEIMVEKTKGMKAEVVTREYTINLHKRLHGWLT